MIRRFLSIALLVVFAFEFGGYLVMISVLKNEASSDLREKIESGLLESSDLTEVKVQFSLPYPINHSMDESVDAEFTAGKNSYQLVSQSIQNDTLSIVLAKDHRTARLESVLSSIQENLNDDESNEEPLIPTHSIQDFIATSIHLSRQAEPWCIKLSETVYSTSYKNLLGSTPEQPPRI
ncbi:MAG: hypothetical protein FJZ78_11545 [Bacteroidetes bacterium]|nr:hypothetical protein [Bacteroidota bacterium]